MLRNLLEYFVDKSEEERMLVVELIVQGIPLRTRAFETQPKWQQDAAIASLARELKALRAIRAELLQVDLSISEAVTGPVEVERWPPSFREMLKGWMKSEFPELWT